MYVYELADLERLARDTEDLHDEIKNFTGYVWTQFEGAPDSASWRAERYPQLCSAPRIQQELRILREVLRRKAEALASQRQK